MTIEIPKFGSFYVSKKQLKGLKGTCFAIFLRGVLSGPRRCTEKKSFFFFVAKSVLNARGDHDRFTSLRLSIFWHCVFIAKCMNSRYVFSRTLKNFCAEYKIMIYFFGISLTMINEEAH